MGQGDRYIVPLMYPINKVMSLGSAIEYLVCTDCGYIIEGYLKDPEKFKGTM